MMTTKLVTLQKEASHDRPESISLKRKIGEEERSLSVSSTSTEEYLEDKLGDQSSHSSDSELEQENASKKRRVDTQDSELNETEQHLIENDTDELQTALVIKSFEEPFIVDKAYPIPDLGEHEVLVHNKFIGLNPIDWKGKKYRFGVYSFPWIQGRESSGVVEKLGTKVKNLSVGDEVFIASTSYRDLRTSTFQEYTIFDSRLVWRLPKNISLKEGSAIGVGLVTASSVLEELNVNIFENEDYEKETYIKPENRDSLLVWGGSSGVGSYVIQLAKIAGFKKVIAVSSPKHEEFLKNIGATHVLDRFKHLDELKKELEEISPDGLQIGVDVVGKQTSDSVIHFLNLNKTKDSQKKFVGVVSKPSKDLDPTLLEGIVLKEVLLKKFHENVKFGEALVKVTHKFLESGEIKSQKNLKHYKGFEGIKAGLEDLEKFGASNEKYIVEL
jgi:NADPH:quinone reductase-like Zn-dependent oxidoreductase